jgi:hypothetical protein
LLLGTAFGIWALVALHSATAYSGRSFTRRETRRRQHKRSHLRRCYFKTAASAKRTLCENRTAVLASAEPVSLVLRLLFTAFLILCTVLSVIGSTLASLLAAAVAHGRPWAVKLALGLQTTACFATVCLFVGGVVPEAAVVVFLAQAVTTVLTGAAGARRKTPARHSTANAAHASFLTAPR